MHRQLSPLLALLACTALVASACGGGGGGGDSAPDDDAGQDAAMDTAEDDSGGEADAEDDAEDDAAPDVPDGDDGTPGAICDPCTLDEECGGEADRCIQLPNEAAPTCATDCTGDTESCPEGYACATVSEEPLLVQQCVPSTLLCDNPCETLTCDNDGEVCHPVRGECGPPLGLCDLGCIDNAECGGESDECIVLPDTGEQMCAQDCSEEACPAGYFCATVGEEPDTRMQCVPEALTCVDRCSEVTCEGGQVCDPITGECGDPLGLCDTGCTNNALCGEGPDDICINLGTPDMESVCATGCEVSFDCPLNYFCASLDGRELGVCVPLEVTCRDDRCDGVDCGDSANCDPRTGECVDSTLSLCDPCPEGVNEACGGPDDLCLNLGDTAGTVCTADCTADQLCPDGYQCVQLSNTTRRACAPIGNDCFQCEDADCDEGETCNPLTGECVAPPTLCTEVPCEEGQVCNPDTELCEVINEACTFDTRVQDCFGPVRKCSATRRGGDGVCALICNGDADCTAASPNCVDLYRVGRLCVPDGLGGPTTCGTTAPEGQELGRPCGRNVSSACGADAPVCLQGVEPGVDGFCTLTCGSDADCGGAGTCQSVRGEEARYCLPPNCLCLGGQAVPDDQTDLLAEALDQHGLSRCSFSLDPVHQRVLDPGTPSAPLKANGVGGLVSQPLSAVGAGKALAGELEAIPGSATPLRDAIFTAAARQGKPIEARAPTWDEVPDEGAIDAGLQRFVEAAGGTWDPADVDGDTAAGPLDLQQALGRVLYAAAEVVVARQGLTDALGLDPTATEALFADAPWLFLPPAAGGAAPDLSDADTLALYTDADLTPLYQAAADLAATLEAAFAGLTYDAAWDALDVRLQTPAGWIILGAPGASTHDPAEDAALADPVAVLIDLSGDDVYRFPAGATAASTQPLGLAVDLQGADTYTYAEVADPRDQDAWLPSDAGGRAEPEGPAVRYNQAVSLSDEARQGAGRLGVGLLVDLGDADDTYTSLRMSQGAGVLGLGALFDAGGSDAYALEAFGQGAGLLGVGLLVDLGDIADPDADPRTDTFRAWHAAQGFGAGSGAGLLLNAAGDDTYLAELATGPEDVLYYAPPDRSLSNLNLAQGAGAGVLPPDDRNPDRQALAGGVGVLADLSGADTYTAATWAQGAGYHLGAGFLLDHAGDDTYRARFGAHGAGTLAAVGALLDLEGDDVYADDVDRVIGTLLGAGVNLGAGVFLDASGDDAYTPPSFSAGAGVDNGLGAFFDLAGVDSYDAVALSTLGNALLSPQYTEEGQPRRTIPTYGLFVDAGADADTYERSDIGEPDAPAVGDDATWTQRTTDDEGVVELGAGVDGEGLTGLE